MTTATQHPWSRTATTHAKALACLHEAAHVLCALRHNYRFTSVALNPGGLTGKMTGPRISDPLTAASVALAGPVVEAIATDKAPASVLQQPAAQTDARIAMDALSSGGGTPRLYRVVHSVDQMLRDASAEVVALAIALNHRKRLSFDQALSVAAKAFCADANGVAASATGGSAMPYANRRRMTQDQDPMYGGSSGPPMTMDDVDAQSIVDHVQALYHQLPPDQQDALCQGLGELLTAHEQGGGMGDPNMANGEDEDLDPRGGSGSGFADTQGNNDPDGTGASDWRFRRRRRLGAHDAYVTPSPARAGFAQRWPELMKISVRG
jgi:hypothetical protein